MQADRTLQRIARKAKRGRAAAVVLGASVNGLSFARSLGRRGIPVLMIDSLPYVGTHTRYAETIRAPRGAGEYAFLATLLGRLAELCPEPPVVFSTSDHYCGFVAEHEDWLALRYRFLQPNRAVIQRIIDKSEQYRVAQDAGLSLPRTFFPHSAADVAAAVGELRFPAILKPYSPDQRPDAMRDKGVKVLIAQTAEELQRGAKTAEDLGVPMMIQEVVPGSDEELYGYWGYRDRTGRERAWVTKRKRRQYPPLFGDGSFQETIEAPEVLNAARWLLDAFDYRGFCGIEFKRDARDGEFRLMELNPRSESGNQLAISAGVDLPWIGYQDLCGTLPDDAPVVTPRFGVKFINEEWDLRSFLALRGQGSLALRGWMQSLRGVRSFAIGAWDDPMPLVVSAARVGRAAVRRAASGATSAGGSAR